MKFPTDNLERPAMMPMAAPVGALGAVFSPAFAANRRGVQDQSLFGSALGTGSIAEPKTHQDWATRHEGITTLDPARHFGRSPT